MATKVRSCHLSLKNSADDLPSPTNQSKVQINPGFFPEAPPLPGESFLVTLSEKISKFGELSSHRPDKSRDPPDSGTVMASQKNNFWNLAAGCPEILPGLP
jgi:hypothetical protein